MVGGYSLQHPRQSVPGKVLTFERRRHRHYYHTQVATRSLRCNALLSTYISSIRTYVLCNLQLTSVKLNSSTA